VLVLAWQYCIAERNIKINQKRGTLLKYDSFLFQKKKKKNVKQPIKLFGDVLKFTTKKWTISIHKYTKKEL
jgi:hypothetical protein